MDLTLPRTARETSPGELRETLDGATHWVMEDRPGAYREELEQFLL